MFLFSLLGFLCLLILLFSNCYSHPLGFFWNQAPWNYSAKDQEMLNTKHNGHNIPTEKKGASRKILIQLLYSAYSLCQWIVWLTDCLKLPLIYKQTNNTWNSKNKPVFESLDFRIAFLNFYLSLILPMRKNPQITSKLRIWFRYILSFHQQHNIHKVHFL